MHQMGRPARGHAGGRAEVTTNAEPWRPVGYVAVQREAGVQGNLILYIGWARHFFGRHSGRGRRDMGRGERDSIRPGCPSLADSAALDGPPICSFPSSRTLSPGISGVNAMYSFQYAYKYYGGRGGAVKLNLDLSCNRGARYLGLILICCRGPSPAHTRRTDAASSFSWRHPAQSTSYPSG